MMEKPSPESPGDRAGEGEASSMANFVNLARRLVNVSPEKVAEEQAKYDAETERKKRSKLQTPLRG